MKKLLYLLTALILITALLAPCAPSAWSVSSTVSYEFPSVVLDPGHGGFDGGALTDDGTPEKDVNLAVSLKLRDFLRFLGYRVMMTRDTDCSVETDGSTVRERKVSDIHHRFQMMEEAGNAVFISIHQNHFSQKRYWGTQVFYTPRFPEQSATLAGCIQDAVVTCLQPDNTRQIKACGSSVYLLYHAVKPAVLVECGFLSNDDEAARLRDDVYQQQLSLCIAAGFADYCGGERNDHGQ